VKAEEVPTSGETAPDSTAPAVDTSFDTRRGPNRLLVFLAVVAIVGVSIAGAMWLTRGGDSGAETLVFTIPAGTVERIRNGENPEILPQELHVDVGDKIRIVNRDNVGQTIGPYYVPAGQTVEQTFTEETTLEGLCTAHPSGSIKIVVGSGSPQGT